MHNAKKIEITNASLLNFNLDQAVSKQQSYRDEHRK